MSEEVRKKTRSSLYWNLTLKIPYEIFRFAASIATARILDPKDFGIVSIATIVIYYSNSFTNFGFNQALVQRKEITDRHINSVFTFDLAISVCMALLIFLSSGAIAGFFSSPESENVIKVLSFVFIITTLHDLPYVLLRREIDFKVLSIVDMVRDVSMSIMTLALAYLGFKYWSIVAGHLIPLFFAMLYLLYKMKRPLKVSYHHASLKELFNFSIWSFVQMQVHFLSSRIDRIIIGRALNITMLGVYEKAKGFMQMPSESMTDKITTVFFSSFSRVQHNREEIKNLFNKGLVLVSALNFPIYFGLYAVAPHFVIVLLGEKWAMMVVPLQIMSIAGLFFSLNSLLSSLAVSTGHYKSFTIRFAASTGILIIGSLLAVSSGIDAVAAVLILYASVHFYLSFALVSSAFDLSWKNLAACLFPAFAASIVMGIALEVGKVYFFGALSLFNLFALVAIGGFVYTFCMAVVPSSILSDIRSSVYRDIYKVWLKIRGRERA